MEKRYQVFISSTYTDLKDERSHLMQALMEMDCIPAGMELFPAFDEEQFEFIKRVIDDCDYYVLLIGGRYGSTTPEGLSYTEKEYDYAIDKGLKVIALIHEDPDSIPVGKTDKDPDLQRRLVEFRNKVREGRLVKFWRSADQLPSILMLSLTRTIKTYPALGWMRGGVAASKEILEEINQLRKENADLRSALAVATSERREEYSGLATLDEIFPISISYRMSYGAQESSRTWNLTFGSYFSAVAPHLMKHPSDEHVETTLKKFLLELSGIKPYISTLRNDDFQTFKLQMKALGLVELKYTKTTKGNMALFWSLTGKGNRTLMDLRVVRKSSVEE